mmetsp:Transcript_11020/g.33042  ORF Transcript_11020/g.33042 Transcript_11020/m.33042 type:complete len:199 (-) Transcript_11020:157-753(-)
MGNDVPRSCQNRLAVGAMMSVSEVEKPLVRKVRDKFVDVGSRSGNPKFINRDEFDEALATIQDLADADRQILDRLFIMLDRTGEERVNLLEFAVGIVPLITASTADKLEFALELYDASTYVDARFVLTTLNAVASYFGDPVLRADQLEELVDEAALALDPEKRGDFSSHADLAAFVARHPLMTDFLEGKGPARYGSQP